MEAFYMLLGTFIIYSWVHASVLVIKNLKKDNINKYEGTIMWVAYGFAVLFIIGTIWS